MAARGHRRSKNRPRKRRRGAAADRERSRVDQATTEGQSRSECPAQPGKESDHAGP